MEGVRKSSIQVKRLTLISFVCNRKEEEEKMCLPWVIRIFFSLSLSMKDEARFSAQPAQGEGELILDVLPSGIGRKLTGESRGIS